MSSDQQEDELLALKAIINNHQPTAVQKNLLTYAWDWYYQTPPPPPVDETTAFLQDKTLSLCSMWRVGLKHHCFYSDSFPLKDKEAASEQMKKLLLREIVDTAKRHFLSSAKRFYLTDLAFEWYQDDQKKSVKAKVSFYLFGE